MLAELFLMQVLGHVAAERRLRAVVAGDPGFDLQRIDLQGKWALKRPMDVTTVNLIIIILTVAIMSGIASSLSSRTYRRAAALTLAFVALCYCGEVYRNRTPLSDYRSRE